MTAKKADKKADKKQIQPAHVVYPPPLRGLPFLAVVLMPDGSVTAKPFSSVEEAIAYNHSTTKKKRH
jgi:L-2-hydroxyglutarate oxidase LhgO